MSAHLSHGHVIVALNHHQGGLVNIGRPIRVIENVPAALPPEPDRAPTEPVTAPKPQEEPAQ